MELHKKCELSVPGFAKGLKCSLRVSRFFEGAREKLRETIVIGRCNFRVWREQVSVIFARLRRGAPQVEWIEIWCGDVSILGGVFWGICSLWDVQVGSRDRRTQPGVVRGVIDHLFLRRPMRSRRGARLCSVNLVCIGDWAVPPSPLDRLLTSSLSLRWIGKAFGSMPSQEGYGLRHWSGFPADV
jgi:hypothetical protein